MTDPTITTTPDAAPDNWVMRAPAKIRPYLRLMRADRPIGVWLLFIPCLWGLGMANLVVPPTPLAFYYAFLFGVGAYAMRGAGCAYNDIIDRDFDAKVERTAMRPIPAGEISPKQAWMFLTALALVGLFVLVQLNTFAIITGLASLGLVAAYPFMKRITYWPQAWLGLTFNWGALVGFAALAGTLSPVAALIYAAGVFWTLGYDTVYAHQDKEDDALIGVKSTALRLGAASKKWLAGFFLLTVALFALAGWSAGAGAWFFVALTPATAHFAWQLHSLDINDSANCLRLFKSNREAGLLLCLSPICELVARSL